MMTRDSASASCDLRVDWWVLHQGVKLASTEKESSTEDKRENETNTAQKVSKRSLKENKKDRKTKEQQAEQTERTEQAEQIIKVQQTN